MSNTVVPPQFIGCSKNEDRKADLKRAVTGTPELSYYNTGSDNQLQGVFAVQHTFFHQPKALCHTVGLLLCLINAIFLILS